MPRPAVKLSKTDAAKQVLTHGVRAPALALQSPSPTDKAWALATLLVASQNDADINNTEAKDLHAAINLEKNAALLPALVPLAREPDRHEPHDAFAHKQRLAAWTLLRNLALFPVNETPLIECAALHRLVVAKLMHALAAYDDMAPLAPADVNSEAVEPATERTAAKCELNDRCTRGLKHGGFGGPCCVPSSRVASASSGRAGSKGSESNGAARVPLPSSSLRSLVEKNEVPLLSHRFDARTTTCALEVLIVMLRIAHPDTVVASCGDCGLPSSAAELVALLVELLLVDEPCVTFPAIEALGRIGTLEASEKLLTDHVRHVPATLSILIDALNPELEVGRYAELRPESAAALYVQESALELLHVFSGGDTGLQRTLVKDGLLIGRLIPFLHSGAPSALQRLAAQVLLNLAQFHPNRPSFRPYEAGLAHLAAHTVAESGSPMHDSIAELLRLLSSVY